MNENRYMNRTLITIVLILLLALLCYGTYDYCKPVEVEETGCEPKEEIWIPTEEDIAYQDSMYSIIRNTQSDVDTIKVQVQKIIERLEHSDIIIYVDNKEEADWSGTTQGN
jgi:hypothetical protein